MKIRILFILAIVVLFTTGCHKHYDQFYVDLSEGSYKEFFFGNDTTSHDVNFNFVIYNNYYYTVQDYVYVIVYLTDDGQWEEYIGDGNYIGDHTTVMITQTLESPSPIVKIFFEVYEIIPNCHCYYGCHTPVFRHPFFPPPRNR